MDALFDNAIRVVRSTRHIPSSKVLFRQPVEVAFQTYDVVDVRHSVFIPTLLHDVEICGCKQYDRYCTRPGSRGTRFLEFCCATFGTMVVLANVLIDPAEFPGNWSDEDSFAKVPRYAAQAGIQTHTRALSVYDVPLVLHLYVASMPHIHHPHNHARDGVEFIGRRPFG